MFYAAKEFVEKRAMKRGRDQERERIKRILAQGGIALTPEVIRRMDAESNDDAN